MNPRLVVMFFVVASVGVTTIITVVRNYLLTPLEDPPGSPKGSSDQDERF